MAYYNDDNQDEDELNQGFQTGPESSIITGQGAAGSSPQTPAGKPDSSNSFVGLQTYLNANKPQAEKLGEQTASIVDSSADAARQGVQGLNQKFNQAVDQSTVQKDQDAMGLVGSTPENLSADQRAQLKKQYGATYGGPSQLADLNDDYSQTMKAANLASQNVNLAGTEEGRSNLVKQVNNAPRTKGATTFDQILLQTGPGRQKLIDTASRNADVKNLLPQAEQAAQQKAQEAKTTTQKTQADTLKSVQDALAGWQAGFEPKLAQAQDTSLQSRLASDIGGYYDGSDPYLDSETYQELGQVNPHDRIYKLNLQDYLSKFSPSDVNAANVASPEDFARYGALADLAGVQDPYLKQADAAKAGTAPKFSVDQQRLGKDLTEAKTKFMNEYKTKVGLGAGVAPDGGNYGYVPQLEGATIEELDTKWIPWLKNNGGTDAVVGQNIQMKVDEFKNQHGYNNVLKSTLDKAGNTSDGKVHAWI